MRDIEYFIWFVIIPASLRDCPDLENNAGLENVTRDLRGKTPCGCLANPWIEPVKEGDLLPFGATHAQNPL